MITENSLETATIEEILDFISVQELHTMCNTYDYLDKYPGPQEKGRKAAAKIKEQLNNLYTVLNFKPKDTTPNANRCHKPYRVAQLKKILLTNSNMESNEYLERLVSVETELQRRANSIAQNAEAYEAAAVYVNHIHFLIREWWLISTPGKTRPGLKLNEYNIYIKSIK